MPHHRLLRKTVREVEFLFDAVLLQQLFDVGFRGGVRVHPGKGVDALLEQVDGKLAHLAHLFVERHAAELLFDQPLDLFVARNRRSGSRKSRRRQQRADGAE